MFLSGSRAQVLASLASATTGYVTIWIVAPLAAVWLLAWPHMAPSGSTLDVIGIAHRIQKGIIASIIALELDIKFNMGCEA